MSNRDKANKTYILLQQRKRNKERRKEQDYMLHAIENLDRTYKKNYKGLKRRGQI
ncbi:hypothetical protein [Clostridium botulinum]|uniref:Uncharacterized protein n=1 Tax=Clostridium botulinum (strain Kyoto / Type A2) TaxID=536232 RepID=C1FRB9_CLOBJ|nr:hypothetical protein [Clostridium botulinum]ACO86207.1 hypothetical protein CLM_2553 [Clostridium botulinum A2 str. Kyoto]